MNAISIDGASLYQKRPGTLRHLIAPLLSNPPKGTVGRVGAARDKFTLGAIPINQDSRSFVRPGDSVVSTRVSGLLLTYYETWRAGGDYFLENAYLHILRALRSGPVEIFALHTDPYLKPTAEHFKYQRGPHIHIQGAVPDISRAHLSVCVGDVDLGGSRLSTLTATFGAAVRMIREELFPFWESGA